MAAIKSEEGVEEECPPSLNASLSTSTAPTSATTLQRNDRRQKKAKLLKSRVKKLEKKLELYDRRIKLVMESEVSLEEMDSDTSAYLHEDVLKRKFLKTWVELCDLLHISPEVQVGESICTYKGTRYPAINNRVQRLLRHGEFPDYWDVCQLVQRVNEKHKLNITEKDCQTLSLKVFTEIGEQLKRRRMKMWSALSGCHLTDNISNEGDPAISDPSLSDALASSLVKGKKSLDEVYDKFAFLQEEEGDGTASSTNEEEQTEGLFMIGDCNFVLGKVIQFPM